MKNTMGRKSLQTALAASVALGTVAYFSAPVSADTPRYDVLQGFANKLTATEKVHLTEVLNNVNNLTLNDWNNVIPITVSAENKESVRLVVKSLISISLNSMSSGDVSGAWTSFKNSDSFNDLNNLYNGYQYNGNSYDGNQVLDLLFDSLQEYYNYSLTHTEDMLTTFLTNNDSKSALINAALDHYQDVYPVKYAELSAALHHIGLTAPQTLTIYNDVINKADTNRYFEQALTAAVIRQDNGGIYAEDSNITSGLTEKDEKALTLKMKLNDGLQNIGVLASIGGYSVVWQVSDQTIAKYENDKLIALKPGTVTVSAVLTKGNLSKTLISEVVTIKQQQSSGDNNEGNTSSPSGGQSTPPKTTEPTQPPAITPAGPVISAPVEKVETPAGTKVVAKVDEAKLTDLIAKGEVKDKVAVTIENAQGEIAEAVISTKAIQALTNNNPNTVIEIATNDVKYNLPAKEINVASLAQALGVAAEDVEISIQINTVEAPSNVANNNIVSPVLEFTIVARSGDKNVTIDKFTTYVERQVVADKNVNSKNIVAVRINEDGSLSPVPTLTDGNVITFKSNSNSKYTVIENNITFADIQGSWAKNDIETLANKLIIKGVDDNKFAPKAETTRAQLATLLTRTLGLQGQKATKVSFKDVKGNEWFAGDLSIAVNAGLVGGYEDGTFKPNQTITRQEAAAMIKRAMDFATYDKATLQDDKKASSLYKDYNKVGNWAKNDIEIITQAGIMGGNEKGQFNPTDNTTREQLASILKRFMTFVKFTN